MKLAQKRGKKCVSEEHLVLVLILIGRKVKWREFFDMRLQFFNSVSLVIETKVNASLKLRYLLLLTNNFRPHST